ncbi:hypothetical protein [Natronobacterium texcoconense]|uniref:Coiled-coil protein n=1 Tax=Natronobacterium texcoconense TaxID=1095778 RepID=A0A1H1J3W8_NATTX|nr:hypothetical protein [Natronobacterium texcoconense]SDR44198.1 hypothetical protein SAMN04489842_4064 [Natronobacterium texcoconense]
MQIDRWGVDWTALVDWSAAARDGGTGLSAVSDIGRLETVVGFVGTSGTALALVGAVLVAGGTVAVAIHSRRSASPAETSIDVTEETQTEGTDPLVEFEERIGDGTLDRLEPIAPDAVDRVREFDPAEADDSTAAIDRLERDLRRGIEDAIADGRLDPGVTSSFGESYEIVNLPSQYREVSLPPSEETIHVADVEAVARDVLEDEEYVRDAARTVATLFDHCREIETYVDRQEETFRERHAAVEDALADVRELTDRLEGDLGERVGEFVLEGRHDEIDGVLGIERQLEEAIRQFHRCAFDDATRTLEESREQADDLLVTVDLLGGLVGTIDHGGGTVGVPENVPVAVLTDLAPVVERQYDVVAEVDGREIVVENRSDGGSEPENGTENGTPPAADEPPARDRTREQVTAESVADEVLFVLRELESVGDGNTVECQTGRLPDAVAKQAVLEELARFCRRQTDVVVDVELQEDAPPGFLEIEFDERTNVAAGLETIRDRFADRHVK